MPRSKRAPVVAADNARRLRSVIEGDWSPYQTRTHYDVYVGPVGHPVLPIDDVQTDFALLRHDIHVLLHAATSR